MYVAKIFTWQNANNACAQKKTTTYALHGVFDQRTASENYWYGAAVPGRTRCGTPALPIYTTITIVRNALC